MRSEFFQRLQSELDTIKTQGLYKEEKTLIGAQAGFVATTTAPQMINLCANNYLGLASNPQIIAAAHEALDQYGFGMASVRFICGTQTIHRQLEQELSDFLGMEDTILYSSCFDANGGLFETLLGEEDAIISDALNHASIIDGIRLCKARRYRYANNDLQDLRTRLEQAKAAGARTIMIVTDGVFSMDGTIADLAAICDLADQFDALVMVDDSHGVGFLGENGRGSHEHCGVMGRVDIITGTLGKALGGASGGYTSAKQTVIDMLRQRSRPYLFSNSLAPMIVATSLTALRLITQQPQQRQQLFANARFFREALSAAGFTLKPGEHPIIPIMIGDAQLTQSLAQELNSNGVLVTGFSYPVVPLNQARIRTQMNASHSQADLEIAVAAFTNAGKKLGII
ncbi:glycine C-acetyltransferase [Maribrevibacterium harenarium]|uniref:2-amino-3-ketobutyrate coenzyme A ligase n=1 Tax=Maribrevibacterium harenarium TaxID=2589817 RepID=A0A501WY79_9GAMM|nr:glycine C-acetyltransferase [Maribrevibacterium harenarium]TPE50876.1 glycine C-acetyltransferase [Maribrevibacterium harenarium]